MMSNSIETSLKRLEERLSTIEKHLGLSAAPAPVPVLSSPRTDLNAWADHSPTVSPSVANEKPMNWLGFAAIVCFVLAAGFIIKLSIDSGWLTPTRQIGISGLLGIAFIAAGLKFIKFDREYIGLLPSAGIIILYLTSFATHRYYDLMSFETAITITSLISALCIGLYSKIKHDIYAVTAAIGAYLSPVILGVDFSTEFSFYYFLICSLSFATISIFLKSRILLLISANLAILMTAITGLDMNQHMMIATHLGIHFILFSMATFFYSKHHGTPLTENEAWSFLPVLLVFYAAEYFHIDKITPSAAPWISLGFAGVLLVLYMSARKLFPNGFGSQSLILAFITLVCFHSIYIELLPMAYHPWLMVAFILVATFAPLSSKPLPPRFFVPAIAIGLVSLAEYASLANNLFQLTGQEWVPVSLVAIASIWAFLLNKTDFIRPKTEGYYAVLGSAHFLAILGLFRLTIDVSSLAVSASWLFYAVAVMLLATKRKDDIMAKSALVVLALAAGKALLYDASSAPTLVRIFCLLLTGAVLYGCGFLMRRVATWNAQK